ncbi:hypothetical protein [Xenorhabdus aichiensis]|nr:hypothetical protein [Xenorhabdus aichiensis]
MDDKSYNSYTLWSTAYQAAKNINISEETAEKYADATIEMYEFGKKIN